MSKRISREKEGEISKILFKEFKKDPVFDYLKSQLKRYLPLMSKWAEAEIEEFAEEQIRIRVFGELPMDFFAPLPALNPSFIDSTDDIKFKGRRTWISTKENGYRLRQHVHPEGITAFTRQFTPYDLRMFPEVDFSSLPVMIGDGELINAHYSHLAGFNRVQERIPQAYWPLKGSDGLDAKKWKAYKALGVMERPELALTFAFHGLEVISDPETWDLPLEEQVNHLISLTKLPVDEAMVTYYLEKLQEYIIQKAMNMRVVPRREVHNRRELEEMINADEAMGNEGSVVVQFSGGMDCASRYKLKKYESIDMVLLGVRFKDPKQGLSAENMEEALLGLWDEEFDRYLPACKVNLDPDAVQVKTSGQKKRLVELREDIYRMLNGREEGDAVATVKDVFLQEAQIKLKIFLGIEDYDTEEMFDKMPRGQRFSKLLDEYKSNREEYDSGLGSKKSAKGADRWIYRHRQVLSGVADFKPSAKVVGKIAPDDMVSFFDDYQDSREASGKLRKPHYIADTSEGNRILIEAMIFDIKYGKVGFAAGFHSEHLDSFNMTNAFPARIRNDKSEPTDYGTVHTLAQMYKSRPPTKDEIEKWKADEYAA